ncbi:MAG: DUF2277 domain-containing protein [Chthonomonadales bacterium]
MCRSIKKLRGQVVVSEEEIVAAALQYIRKISGFQKPSNANQPAFDDAVQKVAAASRNVLVDLGVPLSGKSE